MLDIYEYIYTYIYICTTYICIHINKYTHTRMNACIVDYFQCIPSSISRTFYMYCIHIYIHIMRRISSSNGRASSCKTRRRELKKGAMPKVRMLLELEECGRHVLDVFLILGMP